MTNWRSSKNQKKLRIRLAVLSYAYEFLDQSLIPDPEYDELAKQVDTSIPTDRPDLDEWFKENYSEYTGSWVHRHPEIERIAEIAEGIVSLN
ncbi:MAG: hypothetical protein HRT44_12145 [Bdellovibrionales bacterium]|nr:hypothetical protein [Bdellovibrionales bacterium]